VKTALRAAPLLLAAASGCARLPWLRTPARLPDCPAPLVSTTELPGGDFRLREQVRYRGADVDAGFELVVERRGDQLVVVGLNSFGARVFSAVQRGVDVEVEAPQARMLPVPAENVLRDLHATRFADPSVATRAEITRPHCGYVATFVRTERRALDAP
jgi:hypothetical protein